MRGLFAAHFGEGRQLSDHDVLRDVAGAVGLDERTDRQGARGRCLQHARCEPTRRRPSELDVTGVPYFLINGAWPIPGAQDVETMGIVLRRAWSRLGQ